MTILSESFFSQGEFESQDAFEQNSWDLAAVAGSAMALALSFFLLGATAALGIPAPEASYAQMAGPQ
jgi:hypothetical protein